MNIVDNGLKVIFADEDLPKLQELLNRAMNTWEPRNIPAWAWQLDARVVARLNDLKAAGQ